MMPTSEIINMVAAVQQAHLNTGSNAAPLGGERWAITGSVTVIGSNQQTVEAGQAPASTSAL
jgi:hypothetical protein